MIQTIQDTIKAAVPDAETHVASPDGQHFEAVVISPAFIGLSLVKQHQMVMRALTSEFAERVHALQLRTFTPAKWAEEQGEGTT